MCGLFEWKQIYKCFLAYVYTCISIAIGDQVIKREGWDPINQLNTPHFCACLKRRPGFLTLYVVVFLYSETSVKMGGGCSLC